jgi:hypothetical protein
MKYEVIELLQDPAELDDLGRDMVKTRCLRDGKPCDANVYIQHPVDNRLIEVGYVVEL